MKNPMANSTAQCAAPMPCAGSAASAPMAARVPRVQAIITCTYALASLAFPRPRVPHEVIGQEACARRGNTRDGAACSGHCKKDTARSRFNSARIMPRPLRP
eukprot:jgi/Mesvir1/11942/Mv00273-RA.1